MGTTNFYSVRWHYEISGIKADHVGGAGCAEQHQDCVSAAASDAATITAVLVSKYGTAAQGAKLVIDGVDDMGPSALT